MCYQYYICIQSIFIEYNIKIPITKKSNMIRILTYLPINKTTLPYTIISHIYTIKKVKFMNLSHQLLQFFLKTSCIHYLNILCGMLGIYCIHIYIIYCIL